MDEDEVTHPLGVVPISDRGSLPFALVHGESLVVAASWALTTAGAELFDYSTPFEQVRRSGRALVLHDPLCPLTPADFISAAIEVSSSTAAVVVGVRPVTDTVKATAGDLVGATVDRADLVTVVSPVVLPAAVLAALETLDAADFATLVDALRQRWPVRFLEAPPLARRISTQSDLDVLEALSETTS